MPSARTIVYSAVFLALFALFASAGYLAQADQEVRSAGLISRSPVQDAGAGYQPIGTWFHCGYDPLLGPFEERLDLMSIGTFTSLIHAPLFAEDPIIIRGFWRREDDSSIGLYVSNYKVNEIRYDPSAGVFANAEGYRYVRVFSRDVPERIHLIMRSAFHQS